MITTLDTYFKEPKKEEEEYEYKYYQQPGVMEESNSKKDCKEKGYAYEDITTIAKWIRQDLKEAFGKTIKFSVTSRRYPREINVKIKEIDIKHIMKKDDFKEYMICSYLFDEDMYDYYLEPYTTMKAFKKYHIIKETYETIQHIINKYNYDNSDPYTDYFDVNYYDFWDIKESVTVHQ